MPYFPAPPPCKNKPKNKFSPQSKFTVKLNPMPVKQIKLNFSMSKHHRRRHKVLLVPASRVNFNATAAAFRRLGEIGFPLTFRRPRPTFTSRIQE